MYRYTSCFLYQVQSQFGSRIKKMKEKVYYAAKARLIFSFNPVLSPRNKDLILHEYNWLC